MFKHILGCLALTLPLSLLSAQPLSQPQLPSKQLPPLSYSSPFAGYQSLREQEIESWRDANAKVRDIGGWRAYAREAQSPTEPLATQPPKPSPAPAGSHGGHR